MTDFNDYTFEMDNGKLSPEQIDKILQGKIDASQLSGAAKHLADLVAASKSPASADELAHEASVVSGFKEALSRASVASLNPERKRKLNSKLLTAKLVGAALAASALSGTAVAAYHGDLPTSIQSTLSDSLSKVGISIPSSGTSTDVNLPRQSSSSATTGVSTTTSSGSQNGLNNGVAEGITNGSSIYGLCTAYLNSSSRTSSGTTTSQPTTTTTTSSSTSTTSGALAAVNLTSTSSTTSTTSATTSTTGATSSTISGSAALQRLQAYAKKADESVSQLCSTVSHPTGASSAHKQGLAKSRATTHSNGNANSHSPFSSSSSISGSHADSSTTTIHINGSNSRVPKQHSLGNATFSNGNKNSNDNASKGLSHNPFG